MRRVYRGALRFSARARRAVGLAGAELILEHDRPLVAEGRQLLRGSCRMPGPPCNRDKQRPTAAARDAEPEAPDLTST